MTPKKPFSLGHPQFTYADALTWSRLVMLPYLIYGLARGLAGLATITFAVMVITDLIDGSIARRTGQARPFGAAFDSAVDFLMIYSLFTSFFALGVIEWWKWAAIFFPGLLVAVTQLLHAVKVRDVEFAPSFIGKVVGQIQFIYLPFLLARTFWLKAPWARAVDHAVFGVLVVAILFNTIAFTRILSRLFKPPYARG